MLDINLIRNNKEVILNDLKKRGDKDLVKTLDEIIELDKRHNALKKQLDGLKHKRNTSSREISELIKQKKNSRSPKPEKRSQNIERGN